MQLTFAETPTFFPYLSPLAAVVEMLIALGSIPNYLDYLLYVKMCGF